MSAIDFEKDLKYLPNIEGNRCFFCGTDNHLGLKMKFYTDGKKVYSSTTIPAHLCGWNNLAHGGVVTALLDEIMSWSSSYLLKKIILTKTITVDFIKPVMIGDDLIVEGEVAEQVNDKEAIMKGYIYNSNRELLTQSTGTFALFSIEEGKKLGVMEEKFFDEVEDFFNI